MLASSLDSYVIDDDDWFLDLDRLMLCFYSALVVAGTILYTEP